MAFSEYVFALFALLCTLLVPFVVLHQMLRMKRRAVRGFAPSALRSDRR
ncbi:hypothetical protein ACLH0K_13540 [Arthrobacter sp. MPF02]